MKSKHETFIAEALNSNNINYLEVSPQDANLYDIEKYLSARIVPMYIINDLKDRFESLSNTQPANDIDIDQKKQVEKISKIITSLIAKSDHDEHDEHPSKDMGIIVSTEDNLLKVQNPFFNQENTAFCMDVIQRILGDLSFDECISSQTVSKVFKRAIGNLAINHDFIITKNKNFVMNHVQCNFLAIRTAPLSKFENNDTTDLKHLTYNELKFLFNESNTDKFKKLLVKNYEKKMAYTTWNLDMGHNIGFVFIWFFLLGSIFFIDFIIDQFRFASYHSMQSDKFTFTHYTDAYYLYDDALKSQSIIQNRFVKECGILLLSSKLIPLVTGVLIFLRLIDHYYLKHLEKISVNHVREIGFFSTRDNQNSVDEMENKSMPEGEKVLRLLDL